MRQAGILAAAGSHALAHHIPRLAEDHENAARLAAGLAKHAELAVAPAQTNMVFVTVPEGIADRIRRAPRRGRRPSVRYDAAALVHAPRRRSRGHRRRYRLRRRILCRAGVPPALTPRGPIDFAQAPGRLQPRRMGAIFRTMEARALDLQLTGMTCAACAARIEKVLNRADGVHAAVNFATETAHVEFDADKATPRIADRGGAQGRLRRRAGGRPVRAARTRGTDAEAQRYRRELLALRRSPRS